MNSDEAENGKSKQPRSAQDKAEQPRESRLALARSNFEPIGQFLSQMGAAIAKEYEGSAELEPRGKMQPIAQHLYEIRYSLRHADDARLALTFIVTGERADLILLQGHERSGPRDLSANPGQVDQHAYRLDEVEELKEAVREKIVAHLTTRDPNRTIALGD
jgi:hypothetical protein